ncbi:hypothetical protein B0T11DRAFT_54440 [Plectosphaerella cucumerina]|uniref:Uncharacterized protein n=1 Tax=Plectosphaerella cucumerina TaxID=40658 RepID=A0A8K0TQ80_9PEZI|nr:hypothetical protein B0T11DRAFT_54440 [Plectosphaerella cucumerina]
MEGAANSKGKGLAHPTHAQPPRRPPDNAFALPLPRRPERPPRAQQRVRWELIPLNITQYLTSTTIVTNADIDCSSRDSFIGMARARRMGLKILPSVALKKITAFKSNIRCRRVVLGISITSHASPTRHVGDPVDLISLQVLPEEYGDVPLTIGGDILYKLLQDQPEFNRFCHTSLVGFGALRVIRDARHALPRRQGRHRHGLEGSSSYVSATPGAKQRPLERPTMLSGGSLPDQTGNYNTPLLQNHRQYSPAILPDHTHTGIPAGFVPAPAIDPAFYSRPANALENYWGGSASSPPEELSGNVSGTMTRINQNMLVQEDYEFINENAARPSDPGPSSNSDFTPFKKAGVTDPTLRSLLSQLDYCHPDRGATLTFFGARMDCHILITPYQSMCSKPARDPAV